MSETITIEVKNTQVRPNHPDLIRIHINSISSYLCIRRIHKYDGIHLVISNKVKIPSCAILSTSSKPIDRRKWRPGGKEGRTGYPIHPPTHPLLRGPFTLSASAAATKKKHTHTHTIHYRQRLGIVKRQPSARSIDLQNIDRSNTRGRPLYLRRVTNVPIDT